MKKQIEDNIVYGVFVMDTKGDVTLYTTADLKKVNAKVKEASALGFNCKVAECNKSTAATK